MPMDPLDPANLLRAALALLAVLGLAALLGRLAAARAAGGGGAARGGVGGGGARRLAVEQALALDPRRRLLLVRCDGREGLILTGPGGDAWLGWLDAPARAGGAQP